MAEKRLAWSGSPYSVLSFVLRRNQDQETRLCKTDYRLTVRTVQPIQFRVSCLPAAVRRGAAIATNHWLGSGGGALGSGPLLQSPHSSHPGLAAESCSDFFIDYCCRMCGNRGCSAVPTRQFFGTALCSPLAAAWSMQNDGVHHEQVVMAFPDVDIARPIYPPPQNLVKVQPSNDNPLVSSWCRTR
jgi:hypothetical protein